tara:strand:- start:47 stop:244 length:198 start_codon:yes stop_codon:yes gene_type:complete
MIIDILNKFLFFLLILSTLNVIRNSFFLLRSFREEEKFFLGKGSLLMLGISISYIIVAIIDGIKL